MSLLEEPWKENFGTPRTVLMSSGSPALRRNEGGREDRPRGLLDFNKDLNQIFLHCHSRFCFSVFGSGTVRVGAVPRICPSDEV